MGHSSLLGLERAPATPAGRDTASLGPSDSSDTGSDVLGIEGLDTADPTQPVDVAINRDVERGLMPADALAGGPSDAAGTGERRSAGADAGRREAADISVDRVVDTEAEGDLPQDDDEDEDPDDDEDPDLAFMDDAEAADPLDDEPNGEP